MLETKAKDSLIKIIDFGTSAVFNPKNKLKQRFGTVSVISED